MITFPKACWICHRTEEDIREIMNDLSEWEAEVEDEYEGEVEVEVGNSILNLIFKRELFSPEFDKPDKHVLLIESDFSPFLICPICEMFMAEKMSGFLFNCSYMVLEAVEEARELQKKHKEMSNL